MYKSLLPLGVLFSLAIAAPPAGAAEPNPKFETYQENSGEYRWRLKSGAGVVLAQSGQGFKTAADAKRGADALRQSVAENKLKFDIFMDESKEQRWMLKSAGGQILAVSGEGYKTLADAEANIETVKSGSAGAEFSAAVLRR